MPPRFLPRGPVIALAISAGLTALTYGSSLWAGIMFDAALDLPRATERSWLEILTSAGPSPYFRPVTLLLWKACYVMLGRNDFVVLHALCLASHIICGWLVYELGRGLLGIMPGLAAAALFVLFPLSYQVVGFVDSLFHSLAALWLLASAVLYWKRRLAGALICGALALFTHEGAAVLLTCAVAGLELIRRRTIGKIGSPWWPAAFAAETGAFLAIWLAVPRWPSTPKLDLPSVQLNAAYFLQALAYPVTMLLGHLPRLGNDVAEVLLATGLVTLALLALAHGRLGMAGFGLLWFAAAVVLPSLLLPWPNYVIDAPRLLYAASAGIALLWAAAIGRGRLLGAALIAAVLVESYAFIAVRERLLDRGADIVRQVVQTALAGGRTYVNVPAFVGPTEPDFLLGHSGITMLPDYFGLDLEVAAATGQRLPIESFAYDDLARPWDVAYGLHGQKAGLSRISAAIGQGGGVYVGRFDPGALRLEYTGRVTPGAGAAPLATFGDWAALAQAGARFDGAVLALHLAWQALAPAPGDYTIFVHVIGEGPQPLVQSDGYPIAGLLSPRDWPAGSLVDDERRIELPPEVRGNQLRVLVGFYDRAAPTSRAPAVDARGARLPADAVEIAAQ